MSPPKYHFSRRAGASSSRAAGMRIAVGKVLMHAD